MPSSVRTAVAKVACISMVTYTAIIMFESSFSSCVLGVRGRDGVPRVVFVGLLAAQDMVRQTGADR